MCCLTAPIIPLRSEHTQVLRNNQPSRHPTSPILPTKDVPLLMKHLLMSAPCTRDSYATVASAPSQNLDKGTWVGVCTNSACSQPTFKHCQKHHLMFCDWAFFVGDSCWLFPVPLGFVLLSIVRIKAAWAQLGTSDFFLLILYSFLLGPWHAMFQWKSIFHSLSPTQFTTVLRSTDKDLSILSSLWPKTKAWIWGISLCFGWAVADNTYHAIFTWR